MCMLVIVALPMVVGAWSMAFLLKLHVEYCKFSWLLHVYTCDKVAPRCILCVSIYLFFFPSDFFSCSIINGDALHIHVRTHIYNMYIHVHGEGLPVGIFTKHISLVFKQDLQTMCSSLCCSQVQRSL